MTLKQRETNRLAIENAATHIENMDLQSLYGDIGDGSDHDEQILAKAQATAVRRIRSLLPNEGF